jgi:hypothetical protein
MRITSGGDVLVGTTSNNGDISNSKNIVAGRHFTAKGSVSAANNTFVTIFTPPNNASYLLTVRVSAVDIIFMETAIIHSNVNDVNVTVLADGSNMDIQESSGDIQVKQVSGASQTISWTALRIH